MHKTPYKKHLGDRIRSTSDDDEAIGVGMNPPVINGQTCFFSCESYDRFTYTLPPVQSNLHEYFIQKTEELNEKFYVPIPPGTPDTRTDQQPESVHITPSVPDFSTSGGQHQHKKELQKVATAGKFSKPRSVVAPRKSWLSSEEQRRYLELHHRYAHAPPLHPTEQERIEINILQELQPRVTAEQDECQRHLRDVFLSSPAPSLHPLASKYMDDKIAHQCRRVKLYPRYYETVDAVSMTIPADRKEFPPLVYVRPLLELGVVPKVILPNLQCGARPQLGSDCGAIRDKYPPAGERSVGQKTAGKPACSKDWNAEVLARKYGCKVVMSTSGLQCLLDNQAPGYPVDWQLPVVVKEFGVTDEDKVHRIIFIDKPLVKQKMSVREKSKKFYKAALKTVVCNLNKGHRLGLRRSETQTVHVTSSKETGHKTSGKQKVTEKVKAAKKHGGDMDDPFGAADSAMDNLETFGTSSLNPFISVKSKKSVNIEQSDTPTDQQLANLSQERTCIIAKDEGATSLPAKKIGGEPRTSSEERDSSLAPDTPTLHTSEVHSQELISEQTPNDVQNPDEKRQFLSKESGLKLPPADNIGLTKEDMTVERNVGHGSSDSDEDGLLIDIPDLLPTEQSASGPLQTEPNDTWTDHTTIIDSAKVSVDEAEIVQRKSGSEEKHLLPVLEGVEKEIKEDFIERTEESVSKVTSAPTTALLDEKPVIPELPEVKTENTEAGTVLPSMSSGMPTQPTSSPEIVVRRLRGRTRRSVKKLPIRLTKLDTGSPLETVDNPSVLAASEGGDNKASNSATDSVEPLPEIESGCEIAAGISPDRVLPGVNDALRMPRRSPRVQKRSSTQNTSEVLNQSAVKQQSISVLTPNDVHNLDEKRSFLSTESELMSPPGACIGLAKVEKTVERNVSHGSSDTEEDRLFIDISDPLLTKQNVSSPLPTEPGVPIRRSARLSGIGADSTDTESDTLTPRSLQKRARKTRSKPFHKAQTAPNAQSPVEAEGRRRSGRLAAKGSPASSTSTKMEPTEDVSPVKRRRGRPPAVCKQDIDDIAPIESKKTTEDESEPTQKVLDSISSTTTALEGCKEESVRDLSEIAEIQEPSDLSEADPEVPGPVLIPLSPVYQPGPTARQSVCKVIPMEPLTSADAQQVPLGHDAADQQSPMPMQQQQSHTGFADGPVAKQTKDILDVPHDDVTMKRPLSQKTLKARRSSKPKDPLTAILQLQDKMLHSEHTPHVKGQTTSSGQKRHSSEDPLSLTNIMTQHHDPSMSPHPSVHVSSGQPQMSANLFSPNSTLSSPHTGLSSPNPVISSQNPALTATGSTQGLVPPSPAREVFPTAPAHPMKENPSSYQQPDDSQNLTYHLWSFASRPLLIRARCHGFRIDNQRVSYVALSPKLEYQVAHGMEERTGSEVIRDWAASYIRQNAPLIRARINAQSSELLMLEETNAVTGVPPKYSHLPPQGLQLLEKVITKLESLSAGSYLLSHNMGDGHCQIRRAMDGDKRGPYDLHFTYTGFSCPQPAAPTRPDWVPIDTTMVLPSHWKQHRIPATFEPHDFMPVFNPSMKKLHKGRGRSKSQARKPKSKGKNKTSH